VLFSTGGILVPLTLVLLLRMALRAAGDSQGKATTASLEFSCTSPARSIQNKIGGRNRVKTLQLRIEFKDFYRTSANMQGWRPAAVDAA